MSGGNLLIAVGIGLAFFIVAVSYGLSVISKLFNNSFDYYQYPGQVQNTGNPNDNPLAKHKSKWFGYRPKGAVLLTKSMWKTIEANIAAEIIKAKENGIKIGRAQAIKEIEERLAERQEQVGFPTNPYTILGVKPGDPDTKVEAAQKKMLDLYAERNFVIYDPAFEDLAAVRRKQISRAFNKIMAGLGLPEDVKTKDFSKGEF